MEVMVVEQEIIAGKIDVNFEMNEVESSNIARIGYNAERQILAIDFKNNTSYQYMRVPPELNKELMESPSKGTFLQSFIKGKFDCMKYDKNSSLIVENKSCK